ncbi:GntR family transcriptional regulator [Clostridium sp. AM58-1XD]|uniref:GntR family transcriptional regulator n=1 Tax=Clostridium sp. AM58-1XD TaxID=2292307 RepID=UPI000E4C583E|nr:GntR family transcriptional regulator [Clostridium sp. AM58-1XD]RGY97149.1 GntR family transcriptional regulator [Clostridium sp. AM58-1XD]
MQNEQSLKDYIYTSILEDIINATYKPNQIITEKEILQRYGCSRSPVREALISLCSDDVLRNIPRCGYQIIHITLEDIENIQRYRLALECGMLRFYYNKTTDEQREKLNELDKLCSTVDGIWNHWSCNTDFHLYLISLSQNTYAYKELHRAMSILRRAYAQYYHDKWNSTIPDMDTRYHIKLIRALEEHNLDDATTALSYDLNDFGGIHLF